MVLSWQRQSIGNKKWGLPADFPEDGADFPMVCETAKMMSLSFHNKGPLAQLVELRTFNP